MKREKKKNVVRRIQNAVILCFITLFMGIMAFESMSCLAANQVANGVIVQELEQDLSPTEDGLPEENGSGFLFVFLAILLLIIIVVVAVVISTATSTAALVGSEEVE